MSHNHDDPFNDPYEEPLWESGVIQGAIGFVLIVGFGLALLSCFW